MWFSFFFLQNRSNIDGKKFVVNLTSYVFNRWS